MNVPVILLNGVTSENPFLPRANGIDLSLPMAPVNVAFGDNGLTDPAWYTATTEGSLFLDAPSGYAVIEQQATDENSSLSRLKVSSSADFFQNQDGSAGTAESGYIFFGTTNNGEHAITYGEVYLTNLDPTKQYDIAILSRREEQSGSSNRVADFSLNGSQTQTIDASNNTTETVWTDVLPDQNGTITINIDKAGRAGYAYLNYVTIAES